MSTRVRRRRVDGRMLWCVSWESDDRRKSAYWYFEREDEARFVHQRVLGWDRGQHLTSYGAYAQVLAAD